MGRSRGGLPTKIHHLVDGRRLPGVVLVSPGQSGDSPAFPHLLDHLRVPRADGGRRRTRPDRVRGDKSNSSCAHRESLRRRSSSRRGRPPASDPVDYRGRNVVERRFCHLKPWRAIATRFDKLVIVYRAAVVLNAVIVWTRHLSDTP
ncbi:transposase [Rhodococcus sp. ACT016]|uniref:transposase n=1 Tax=Rhodococcus sp. ACT016 TaxID=3134808 RepID=UPI003D295235